MTETTGTRALFALNPGLDRAAIAQALADNRLVQIEDFLEASAAEALWQVLREATPYGLAWAGDGQPRGQHLRPEQLQQMSPQQKAVMGNGAASAAAAGRFAFLYGQYPLVEAYRHNWHPGHMAKDWKPDWGGYLNFMDAKGNIVAGFMPRFKTMNLFLVPLRHNVAQVAQFAPRGRFAITGWFRNK